MASIAVIALVHLGRLKYDRWALAALPVYPLGCLLYIAVLWNSAIKALKNGGIWWRETFYPLNELRKHHLLK